MTPRRTLVAAAGRTPGSAAGGAETPAFDVVAAPRSQVGESPLWSAAEQALWWVDIEGRALYRHHPGSGSTSHWPAPKRLACIALHVGGGLIAGMETGVFHLRPQPGGGLDCSLLASARHPRDDMRFNDGRCDRSGRFWLTSMVRDMAQAAADGALFRVDAGADSAHLSAPLVPGLITGNGLAFSPAGDILYLSDSHPRVQRVWAFDLHADGSLSSRRDFVDMRLHPGRPDGAAVDADGCYWTCANDAGLLLRFTPAGRLDRTLALPVSKPSMCAFGGAGLDQLFVTSITPAQPAPGFEAALDGAVLVLRPGVRGIAEVPFGPEPMKPIQPNEKTR